MTLGKIIKQNGIQLKPIGTPDETNLAVTASPDDWLFVFAKRGALPTRLNRNNISTRCFEGSLEFFQLLISSQQHDEQSLHGLLWNQLY